MFETLMEPSQRDPSDDAGLTGDRSVGKTGVFHLIFGERGRVIGIPRGYRKQKGETWVLALWAMLFSAIAAPSVSAQVSQIEVGRRIYLEGMLGSGEPLQGVIAGDVALSGASAACTNCHRRSGLGSLEGGKLVPPITGTALFQDGLTVMAQFPGAARPTRELTRPPYSDETLARAIRDGVSASDRVLDAPMPRYAFTDSDLAALIAYLRTLSHVSSAGVDGTNIHFATIVTPQASQAQRQAMLDVVEAYVRDRNTNPRKQPRPRQPLLPEKFSSDLTWVMHVWELQGPEDTWEGQLVRYYRQHAVFAVLGGIGGGRWHPIDNFCEQFAVACLFPQTNLPSLHERRFYTRYFSKGIVLEAEVLAAYLQTGSPRAIGKCVQVFREEPSGLEAARALRGTWSHDLGELADHPLRFGERADRGFWRRLVEREKPVVLIAWLGNDDVGEMEFVEARPKAVYFSDSLLGGRLPPVRFPSGRSVRVISNWRAESPLQGRLQWMRGWFDASGIAIVDQQVQGNTFWALWLTAVILEHLGGNYSSEHFIEQIEHTTALGTGSLYPRFTTGPGQRYGVNGLFINEVEPDGLRSLTEAAVVP
ncbi:MAG: cytochrome c [Methylococcaceae bacterium]|nr:cytochrome c [Methylococcaceae bacterium]